MELKYFGAGLLTMAAAAFGPAASTAFAQTTLTNPTITFTGVSCTVTTSGLACSPTSTTPPSPGQCTITGPTSATSGVPFTLTANCGTGTSTYSWTGGGSAGQTTATMTDTITAATTYTVTGTTGTSPGTQSSGWLVSIATPPPTGGTGFCANYPGAIQTTLPWQTAGYTSPVLAGTGVVSLQFVVPAGTTGSGTVGWAPWSAGSATSRLVTISTVPCDFRTKVDSTGTTGPLSIAQNSPQGSQPWAINPPPSLFPPAALVAGGTYYLNVQSQYNTRPWDFIITWGVAKP